MRIKCLHLIFVPALCMSFALAQSSSGPKLSVQKTAPDKVRIAWSNAIPNLILERASSLRPPLSWQAVTQPPTAQQGESSVTVDDTGAESYFRLRNGTAALTSLAGTSPASGESDVSVTRETVFRFSRPLAANLAFDANRLFAEFGGRKLLSRAELSSDRLKLTLFYLEPLPGNARVRVTLLGAGLTDSSGQLLDLDADGVPGGDVTLEFDTMGGKPIAGTAVVGRVFASELATGPGGVGNSVNRPLKGVTVTVDGSEESLRAVTDDLGNFKLDPAPAGTFFVHIDGRTSPESKWPDGAYYPFVGKAWTAVPGRSDNLAGGTGEIFLPLITSGTLQPVSASVDTKIIFPAAVLAKNPELTGVEIDVPANSLFSDSGTRGGKVGIAPVPADRLPGPLPPGLDLPLVITIQTDGPSNFDRPVPVRFPNVPDPKTGQKLAPGAKSALWSFNHDIGEWEVVGPMTVTADGNFVETDPGFGVLQPGWHGTRPGTSGNGPPPDLNGPCGGGGGDYFFNESACRARSLNNVANLIKDAANVTSQLGGPGAKDALNLLNQINNTYNDAQKMNALCHACCVAINGDFGCPGSLFGSSSLNASGHSATLLGAADDAQSDLARLIQSVSTLAGMHAELRKQQLDLLGSLTDPALLPADKRATFNQLQTQINNLYAPLSPTDYYASLAGQFSALQARVGATDAIPAPEPALYLLRDLNTGQIQRGRTGASGSLSGILFQPSHLYQLDRLFPTTLAHGSVIFQSGPNGSVTIIPGGYAFPAEGTDSDSDGLPDDLEAVVGTDPTRGDTDGDGILDGAEFRQGLDPLGGLIAATGIIASAPTAGAALDICAINDTAIIAEGAEGVGVFSVFNGLNPVAIAQFDTPGEAKRVTCSGTLIAIADGSAGLAVADISDPANAKITQQVRMPSSAEAVTAAAGLAFVGTSGGQVVAVDMRTGSILQTLDAGGFVHDLAIEGDSLFALTQSELIAWSITPDFLQLLGRVPNNRYFAEGITARKRLSVGGGYAYTTVYPGYDMYNVANPAAMQQVGFSIDAGPNSFKQIVPNGSGLGIAAVGINPRNDGTHDVNLYDVSDPTKTTSFLGSLITPGIARALALYNGLAYVADSDSGLQVINYLPYDSKRVPPKITLTTSFTSGLAEEGKLMRLTATVTDDVQVRNVEFYLDGAKAVTDGNFPFEYRFVTPLATASKTNLTVRARATDTGGNATWSDELTLQLVKDATQPRLRSFAPRNGALLRDAATVSAFFSEPMDPASITTDSFRVTSAGADGKFGTADDQQLTPVRIEFRRDLNGAFLSFNPPLPAAPYRVELTAGLRDEAGLALANPSIFSFRVFDLAGDRDRDGVPDSLEAALGLDPDKADTDDNGIPDGDEDFDKDGLSNAGEVLLGYDPANPDSNGNGIPDGMEDFDKDGIPDGEEVIPGKDGYVTDPTNPDTDGDGLPDGLEIALGLDPTNPADGNEDVVIDGRTVTVNGLVKLKSLSLINGAVLTHPPAGAEGSAGLQLVVGALNIDVKSRIDVSGRGYLGARNAGNNSNEGRTFGNVSGSTRRNGGSYGGLGAFGDAEQTAAGIYGDYHNPNELGGGGGSDSGPAGAGGGLLRITATKVTIDGQILADGGNGDRFAGGGSGGAIRIDATELSGSGVIQANGGNGAEESGGGGGGRVALYIGTITAEMLDAVQAKGGTGLNVAAPGTAFIKMGTAEGQLIVRGAGRETPLPAVELGEILVIDNAVVSATQIDTAQLHLINGAVLTHAGASADTESRLQISVDQLVIDAVSRIDVSGRGYLGARSGGNNIDQGRTIGNAIGSVRRSGGGYGGLGSFGDAEQVVNAVYGDYRNPNELGSGGGSDSNAGGNGGGLVRISAGQVTLDGSILANGFNGSRFAGGGSGGAIRIDVATLGGAGVIQANGGNGAEESGGGGGGRIAIYATSAADALTSKIQNIGGGGFNVGAPGTVYLKVGTDPGQTIVRGTGRETPLPDFVAGERVTIDAARVSSRQMNILELRLINGAVLTHLGATPTSESRLELVLGSLFIDATSRIDLSGRGYLGARSGGNNIDQGRTSGNAVGSVRRCGGGYGGLGSFGDAEQVVNAVYGDYRNPNELGSGGGSDSAAGGSGGGLVRIAAAQVTLDGSILANGLNGGDRYAGGGGGGAIRIDATTLNGAGVIQANGGNGLQQSGGGGGGRIAIYVTTLSDGIAANIQSRGGAGLNSGGAAGTIYLKRTAQSGEFIVRGTGRETPLPEGALGERLLIDGAHLMVSHLAVDGLTLVNGALLTHPGATTSSESRLELTVKTLNVDASSSIDVSGRGYLGARTGGNNIDQGRTLGNRIGSTRRNGGGYGGLGAFGDAEQTANDVYGSFTDPNELGSGGGSDSAAGGDGGGLIRLVADQITLEGAIFADGFDGGDRYAGGGSGGGIKIVTGAITGRGIISANGGSSGAQSGSGGGGRVAISYTNATGFDFANVAALPGTVGSHLGTPGTVYLNRPGSVRGDLLIDAKGTNNPSRPTPLISLRGRASSAVAANILTDTNANFIPGALVGLALKPNVTATKTFTIIANDATTITTAPNDGALTTVAAPGDSYSTELRLDLITIRGRAQAEVYDGDRAQVDRSGALHSANLTLEDNVWLTHPAATTSTTFGLILDVTGTLRVDASSRVDVSASGYLGARSGDNNTDQGRTLGNIPGSTRRNGGGYGGLGAFGNTEQTVNPIYGDFRDPKELGSGGGSDGGGAGAGGGSIRINTGTLVIEGVIASDGGDGGTYAGGGSGGAIKLTTDVLSGNGTIHAMGGDGASQSGGGGGGRVAIYYNSATGVALGNAQALGGAGLNGGGAGTVYRKAASAAGELTVRGPGRETPLPEGAIGEILVVDQARVSVQSLNVAELRLLNGAVLTHPAATIATEPRLELTATKLTVDGASRIDVSARGYLGARSGDNNTDQGRTRGNVPGSTRRNGGSYGGLGAFGNTERTVNPVYGEAANPNELGSGGGSDSGPAGVGGGLVRVTSEQITLDGSVLANGGDGGTFAGGGSGGGIKVTTGSLAGTGVIHANGGAGASQSGGGGGGRVALLFRSTVGFDVTKIEAKGETGLNAGADGTVFTQPRVVALRSSLRAARSRR